MMINSIKCNPKIHFTNRSNKYNTSSNWVNDETLLKMMYEFSEPDYDSLVLDIATGTGLVAKQFYKKVKQVVGIDICKEMVAKSEWVDKIYYVNAENMPFEENYFDIIVCRQGLQFMDLDVVLKEAYRVLKPSGRIVLCHLTSHNQNDQEITFEIQRLRNPARKNFFLPEDVPNALKRIGYNQVESYEYISRESVNQWIDNGAINDEEMLKIKTLYKKADDRFKEIHEIEFVDNDIFDSMKFIIAKGKK